MLIAPTQSYGGCESDGQWKQPVELQSGATLIKMESAEDTANSVPDNHICPKKALFAAGGSDYINKGNVSSRPIKVNLEEWQGYSCQASSNGHLSNSDGQLLSRISLGMAGSVSASAETTCSNYSAKNVRCQEEEAVSKTGVADRSVCKRNWPLSHVNQSEDSKPREKREMVKTEKFACLPSPMSHDDAGSGLHDEQTENCIVVKTEIPSEQHLVCERNPPRQSSVPLQNHASSYKFHSVRTDRCSPGPTSCDLSSSCKLDQGKQGACNQQKSLENSLTPDKSFRDLVARKPDGYTLENRKSRTFQKISKKSVSLNSVYREKTVTEGIYQSSSSSSSPTTPLPPTTPPPASTPPPPTQISSSTSPSSPPPTPPPSSPTSIQSQNKLFSSEALGSYPEDSCVKSSLQYEQSSVINQRHLASPPRKIQERHSCPLDISPQKEAGRNSSQHPTPNEAQSPPVFKNVSEALHRLPESPKVPLVCMKDVIVIDSSPGSETSASCHSSSPEQSPTAKSLRHPRRANSSSKSKTAQRLCFDNEKEATPSVSKTKNLKDNPVSLDKSLGYDTKKDKTVAAKATGNSATSRATEKAFPVNNSDLILSRTDRIRSPSIRYKDDVLFFPLVFPRRSSQSATNRVSEAVERNSNNHPSQAEVGEKVVQKKENMKVLENVKPIEKVNCQSKKNTNPAPPKQTESLDRRRILRGSSVKSENLAISQDAAFSEPSQVIPLSTNNKQVCLSNATMLSTSFQSAPSLDSPLLPPKSNKVLRSQSSSLKVLASPPPSPLPSSTSASLSSQVPNPKQKCSSGSRISSTDQSHSMQKTKTKPNKSNINTTQPKSTSSKAEDTIEDTTSKNFLQVDPSPLKSLDSSKTISTDQADRTQEPKTKQSQHNINATQLKSTTLNNEAAITDIADKSPPQEDPSLLKCLSGDKTSSNDQAASIQNTKMKLTNPDTITIPQPKCPISNAETLIKDVACKNPQEDLSLIKNSGGSKTSSTDQADSTQEPKTKPSKPNINTTQPTSTTSKAEATIEDATCKNPLQVDSTPLISADIGKTSFTDQADSTQEPKIKPSKPNINTTQPKSTTSEAEATIEDATFKNTLGVDPSSLKSSESSKTYFTDQADSTQEPKTKIKSSKPNINTTQPKSTTSKAEATIEDATFKNPLWVDPSPLKSSDSNKTSFTDQADSTQEPKTKIKSSKPNSNTTQLKSTTSEVEATIEDSTCKNPLWVDPSPLKSSDSSKTSFTDQADRTQEPKAKTKQTKSNNTIQSKHATSNAEATITDVAFKSPPREDPSLVKKPLPKVVSKLQSCLRSYSSTSAVIKEPAPLSVLSRPEKASSESKKLNAFVSDELDKYLAQEIGNYAISPQKISISTRDSLLNSKKTICDESKKTVTKKLSLSPKKVFCDKNFISSKKEPSDNGSEEKTTTTVAYNTRRNSSLNSSVKNNYTTNSSISSYMKQLLPKMECDAASSKTSEKQMCTLSKTEPIPNPIPIPTSASSDSENIRILRPRPDQLIARSNKPGSSYTNCSSVVSNSQSYEPDFDEVDGILFMSFPNVESLQAHIAVERKSNWESSPSHMSSISKVLNFNRWKERHKTMKLPRPAFDKSNNLRGLHMRMKMYYKLLRSEWHKIKQRNQHRSRYGFKKTNDFSKIKSWQARLNKNLESKRSSQNLQWRTQDRLAPSQKPEEIQHVGIVKKQKKNFILTRRKDCKRTVVSGEEETENSSKPSEGQGQSVNDRKKQNTPTSHKVSNNVKGPVSGTNSKVERLVSITSFFNVVFVITDNIVVVTCLEHLNLTIYN